MANFFDQFDLEPSASAPVIPAQRPVDPFAPPQAPMQAAPPPQAGNYFDQFEEASAPAAPAAPASDLESALLGAGDPLRHPDGRVTEAGWEAMIREQKERRQREIDDTPFLENLVGGFGRAAPAMIHGAKQLGVDILGHLAGDSTGLTSGDNAVTRWSDSTAERLRKESADERAGSADLMSTGGGKVGNFLGDVLLTAPLGGVGLAPKGAGAVRGITQAAATGGAMGATAPVAREGERGQNIGLGAAFGGGLSALGRGAMSAGENLLPQNVTARTINWFNDRANRQPFAQEGEALAQRTGIELTPGMVSGSRAQTGAENMARQSLFSADRAFEADTKVAEQAIGYVNRVIDRVSRDSVSPQAIGDDVQRTVRTAVDKIAESREQTAAKQFGAIRQMVGDAPIVNYENTKNTLREIIGEYTDVVGADARRMRTQAQRLLDEMEGKEGFSLDAARRARGFYGRAARRSANVFNNVSPDLNARTAKRLYGAMSSDLDAAGSRLDEIAGFGQNMPIEAGVTVMKPSEMLKRANDDYRQHSQMLEAVQLSPLKRLLGDEISVDDLGTINALPPETVIQRIGSMKPSELGQVRMFLQDNSPETWQQYKRMLLEDALAQAQSAPASAGAKTLPFNATGFVRALGGDKPDKVERLKAIFDPGEMAEVMDAMQAARRMGDKFGANFSGTGPYNEMAAAVRNFTIRGLSTTATTAAGFNRVARLMLTSDGRRGLIELSRLPPGSRKANDVAAYLASIAAVSTESDRPLEIDVVGGTPAPAEQVDAEAAALGL